MKRSCPNCEQAKPGEPTSPQSAAEHVVYTLIGLVMFWVITATFSWVFHTTLCGRIDGYNVTIPCKPLRHFLVAPVRWVERAKL